MELFAKLVNRSQQLTIFTKHSITDVWVGSECASAVVSDTPKPVCNGAFSFRIEDESQKSGIQKSMMEIFWGNSYDHWPCNKKNP